MLIKRLSLGLKKTLINVRLVSFLASGFDFCSESLHRFTVGAIIICVIISALVYIRIYRIVGGHQIKIHVQQQAVQSQSDAKNNLNRAQLDGWSFPIVACS